MEGREGWRVRCDRDTNVTRIMTDLFWRLVIVYSLLFQYRSYFAFLKKEVKPRQPACLMTNAGIRTINFSTLERSVVDIIMSTPE